MSTYDEEYRTLRWKSGDKIVPLPLLREHAGTMRALHVE
jgi:hypothetical protein